MQKPYPARLAGRLAIALLAGLFACASLAAAPPKKNPSWSDLTAEQQQILKPLANDWNALDAPRRAKWLGIATRYPGMSPTEQKRMQTRMTDWVKLTPDQRRNAREQYRKIGKLPPEKREEVTQQWEEYQQLPDHIKKNLAAEPQRKAEKAEPRARPKAAQAKPPAAAEPPPVAPPVPPSSPVIPTKAD